MQKRVSYTQVCYEIIKKKKGIEAAERFLRNFVREKQLLWAKAKFHNQNLEKETVH